MRGERLRTGIALFNQGAFFEAHEVLEDVWRECASEQKPALQGLVQLAVAFHHYSTGNQAGACSLLEKARRNLSASPQLPAWMDQSRLLEAIVDWQRAFTDRAAMPSPRLDIPGAKIALP